MALEIKVLPNAVQSILSASAHVNNYKTAVEELVYNSLDAESTSIAIRVHIEENRIQVIDNGYGIMKNDFDALGQRHMTSKVVDLTDLKSIPKCYGYRGEFLANIIEISSYVRIISRHKDAEETWAKSFCKGMKKQLAKMTTRPSKGTTVEIQGFLYNLNIQNKGIDPVNDMQNVKSFLEQLSVAHNDLSLSLRDDSKNEIIFKIHKKRDIYQTLSSLFHINKETVQELQVEKGEYKVKALIGQTDDEKGRHWIYLNGRFIHNGSKMYKTINGYFNKYLLIKDKKTNKSKINHDEDHLFKQNIPFYFIFVICPYFDYDNTKTYIEFKNWEQVNKILEKLVKLHFGDIQFKDNKKDDNPCMVQQNQNKDTAGSRGQIEKIIKRILKSNSKKLDVSQLQNGVKGKMAKRKNKIKTKKINSHRISSKPDKQPPTVNVDKITNRSKSENLISNDATKPNNINIPDKIPVKNTVKTRFIKTKKHDKTNKIKNKKGKKLKREVTPKNKVFHVVRNEFEKIISNQDINEYQCSEAKSALKIDIPMQKKELCLERLINNDKVTRKYENGSTNNACNKNKYQNNNIKPMQLKKNTLDNYVMDKIKTKPYKTTYDLVQTILTSQEFKGNKINENSSNYLGIRFKRNPNRTKFAPENLNRTLIKHNLATENFEYNYRDMDYNDHMENNEFNATSKYLISYTLTCEDTNSLSNYTDFDYRPKVFRTSSLPVESTQHSLKCEDIFREHSDKLHTQNEPCILSNYPTSSITYKSHSYSPNMGIENYTDSITSQYNNKAKRRFITKQSRDNFLTTKEKYRSLNKNNQNQRKYYNNQIKHYSRYVQQTTDESYTIEFSTSNQIDYSTKYDDIMNINHYEYTKNHVNSKNQFMFENQLRDETKLGFGNTYDIPINLSSDNYISGHDQETNIDLYGASASDKVSSNFGNTFTIPCYSILSDCNIAQNQVQRLDTNAIESNFCHTSIEENDCKSNQDNVNIVFVSTSQCREDNAVTDVDLDPRILCETVYNDKEMNPKEFDYQFNGNNKLNDSLYNNFGNDNYNSGLVDKYNTQMGNNQNINCDISHHFGNSSLISKLNFIGKVKEMQHESITKENINKDNLNNHGTGCIKDIHHELFKDANFKFRDRLRFLPKGMSQIFEKCGSKVMCNYNIEKDYYEDIIYNDFANDIRMQSEVYEPVIQNPEDFTTKDINKFKNRVQKDNTSLVFNENSLKDAQVLNQVDCKFIAAIIKKMSPESKVSKYLVLFDQHAVHERIRLEKNLADYFDGDKWKSVRLDHVTLKMSKDEILYLHNYKDKFNQLGLQWNILNADEVSIISIPEAILGKNPREVDKVIKAVKALIVEEIQTIKMQKGCISLYPKSIMDLVFSEACRYAIKFGDKLTKNNCIELLNDLSNCKTPFQCAHGRPVMAVLLEVTSEHRDYKIDMASLRRFEQSLKKTT